jgi:sRNA-binding carbon storage regulator CsrA
MPLTIDLKPGERLQIGDATVTLVQKSGQLARLVIDADKSIPVKKVADSSSIRLIAERGLMTGT